MLDGAPDVCRWSLEEARRAVSDPDLDRRIGAIHGVPAVVVTVGDEPADDIAARLARLPVVSIAAGAGGSTWDATADDPEPILAGVLASPRASVVAAQVLRSTEALDPGVGLTVESLAYATLQSGPEFAAWLETRGRRSRPPDGAARVVTEDHGDHVEVVLSRPRLKNLLDARMRDELVEVLRALVVGGDRRPVTLRGAGTDFCAGGDPAEFGTASDPTSAHLVRAGANVAPWLVELAEQMTARVDGACVGAGVELAAFCRWVTATPDARFRLPELSMGLIPGAGGTVSIPRRIGRQRTLQWLTTNAEIDAANALRIGLVDEISEPDGRDQRHSKG